MQEVAVASEERNILVARIGNVDMKFTVELKDHSVARVLACLGSLLARHLVLLRFSLMCCCLGRTIDFRPEHVNRYFQLNMIDLFCAQE